MKIEIRNSTRWSTRDLRTFITAGLKAERGEWWGTYVVEVKKPRRGQRLAGYGYYRCNHIRLYFKDPESGKGEQRKWRSYNEADEAGKQRMLEGWHTNLVVPDDHLRRMAIVLAHEVDHNKNERHKDMCDRERRVEWCERLIESGFKVHLDRPKPKAPAKPLQEKRAEHAAKMLAEHEAKLKREQKLVRKWKQKVRYYEKAQEKKAAKNG